MVEAREKDLISLREAAKISGYSPDYIGQLIRTGKINGKQVYCNVQWMTTAEAILEYKNKGLNNKKHHKFKSSFRKIGMEINILKLFFKTFKSALPILILVIISFVFLLYFISSNFLDDSKDLIKVPQTEEITF